MGNANMLKLPNNIPVSMILDTESRYEYPKDNELNITDVKIKAHQIYNKYIKVGSEFEINISGIQRDEIAEIMDSVEVLLNNDDANVTKLFELFNECKLEMVQLLRSALNRFKYEDEFDEIRHELLSVNVIPSTT